MVMGKEVGEMDSRFGFKEVGWGNASLDPGCGR